MHSTASDGTDPPETLARLAAAAGLGGFALTDHDTLTGLAAAARGAEAMGLTFLPGVELSADPATILPPDVPEAKTGTLHLLAYGLDPSNPALLATLNELAIARAQRVPAMVEKLNALGVRIQTEDVTDLAERQGAAVIGRPLLAQVLMERGFVRSIHDAFVRYLGPTGAAFVPRQRLGAADAVQMAVEAGGAVVLAHPVQLSSRPEIIDHVATRLADVGLVGIEVDHPDHRPADIVAFRELAARLKLIATAGSDYHGSRKSVAMGERTGPMITIEAHREAAAAVG